MVVCGKQYITIRIEFAGMPAQWFECLAEAWTKTGNKKEAITAYEKVLSLKPDDAKAKKMIEELKM